VLKPPHEGKKAQTGGGRKVHGDFTHGKIQPKDRSGRKKTTPDEYWGWNALPGRSGPPEKGNKGSTRLKSSRKL